MDVTVCWAENTAFLAETVGASIYTSLSAGLGWLQHGDRIKSTKELVRCVRRLTQDEEKY